MTYWGALLLASADLSAVRKLCGFKGHSAHRRAAQNVLNTFLGTSTRKLTTLPLIGTHDPFVMTAAIENMLRSSEKHQHKPSMSRFP